jgi:hypothetical protein
VTLDFAKTSPTNVARLGGFGKEDKNAMSKKIPKGRGSIGDRTRDLAHDLFSGLGAEPEARIIPLDH